MLLWSRVADILFGSSLPLKAKGYSEDAGEEEVSPLAASPVMIMPHFLVLPKVSNSSFGRPPGLDVTDREAESNDDDGRDVDVVGSPARGALVVAEMVSSPRKLPTSSRSSSSSISSLHDCEKNASYKGNHGNVDATPTIHASTKGDSDEAPSSPSESSNFFVSKEDPPPPAAAELGAPEANLIGGNFVGSLHFDS
jgi:hypothetical protein